MKFITPLCSHLQSYLHPVPSRPSPPSPPALVSRILPSIDIAMIWQVCHSAISRATESSRGVYVCVSVYLCRDRQKEVYCGSLGHAIMKAEKSHLLSASGRPRTVNWAVLVQTQRPENWGWGMLLVQVSVWVWRPTNQAHPCPIAGEDPVSFCSIQSQVDSTNANPVDLITHDTTHHRLSKDPAFYC